MSNEGLRCHTRRRSASLFDVGGEGFLLKEAIGSIHPIGNGKVMAEMIFEKLEYVGCECLAIGHRPVIKLAVHHCLMPVLNGGVEQAGLDHRDKGSLAAVLRWMSERKPEFSIIFSKKRGAWQIFPGEKKAGTFQLELGIEHFDVVWESESIEVVMEVFIVIGHGRQN